MHSLVDSHIPVAPLFYTGDVHQKRLVEKTVTRILSGGVDPSTKGQRARPYSTIQKFKGLEVLMHHDLKGTYDAML